MMSMTTEHSESGLIHRICSLMMESVGIALAPGTRTTWNDVCTCFIDEGATKDTVLTVIAGDMFTTTTEVRLAMACIEKSCASGKLMVPDAGNPKPVQQRALQILEMFSDISDIDSGFDTEDEDEQISVNEEAFRAAVILADEEKA